MKKLAFLVLFIAMACAAAGKQKKPIKKATQNDIVSVSIYHTACFGRCAEYKVEVNKNGTATYTGIRFVPDSGIYTKKISIVLAKEIIQRFVKYRIDTFRNNYESRIADLPGVVITVKYSKKTKTITNAHFGPAILDELRASLDRILERKKDESGILPLDTSWQRIGNYKYE